MIIEKPLDLSLPNSHFFLANAPGECQVKIQWNSFLQAHTLSLFNLDETLLLGSQRLNEGVDFFATSLSGWGTLTLKDEVLTWSFIE